MSLPDVSAMKPVVREVLAEVAKQKLRDDQNIVSSGIIDSLSVLKLISKLEDKLKIQIPKDQVQPEDFDSVDMTLETIERVATT